MSSSSLWNQQDGGKAKEEAPELASETQGLQREKGVGYIRFRRKINTENQVHNQRIHRLGTAEKELPSPCQWAMKRM